MTEERRGRRPAATRPDSGTAAGAGGAHGTPSTAPERSAGDSAGFEVERLVPHRPPFLFVDEVLRCGDEGAEMLLRLRPGDPRTTNGRLAPLLLLEALAQAAAAFHGASRAGGPESGVLVEISAARFHAEAREGDAVLLEVRRGPALGALVRLRGRALARGALLVDSELTVMRSADSEP